MTFAAVIEVLAGFFDTVEKDPIPPNSRAILPAGHFDGCTSMILITVIIIRI